MMYILDVLLFSNVNADIFKTHAEASKVENHCIHKHTSIFNKIQGVLASHTNKIKYYKTIGFIQDLYVGERRFTSE